MFFSVITNILNWEMVTKNLVTFKDGMGLKMRHFSIMEVLWKIRIYYFFEGGMGRGGDCWQFGLAKERWWCFWGGIDTPVHTMPLRLQDFEIAVT